MPSLSPSQVPPLVPFWLGWALPFEEANSRAADSDIFKSRLPDLVLNFALVVTTLTIIVSTDLMLAQATLVAFMIVPLRCRYCVCLQSAPSA
jgi:hypothetical protein